MQKLSESRNEFLIFLFPVLKIAIFGGIVSDLTNI